MELVYESLSDSSDKDQLKEIGIGRSLDVMKKMIQKPKIF